MRPRDLPQLLKEAASEWIEDGAMRLSSSLAYYAIFSLHLESSVLADKFEFGFMESVET